MSTELPVSISRRRLMISTGGAALAGVALAAPTFAQSTPAVANPPAASPPAAVPPMSSPAPGAATPPPEKPSDMATAAQLALAKAEGDAYGSALSAVQQLNVNQAVWIGNYQVIVLAQKAGGVWMPEASGLTWTDPGDKNAHLEVAVRDAGDGRFVPGLTVSMSITAPDGSDVGTNTLPFIWHPFFHHYGLNWKLPGDGEYAIHVTIPPAPFPRHDKTNGNRFADPVELDVKLKITTGQQ